MIIKTSTVIFMIANLVSSFARDDPPPPPSFDSYLPPQQGTFASGGELGAPILVNYISDCESACTSNPSCISFSILSDKIYQSCGIQGECYAPNTTSCPSQLSFMCYNGIFSSVTFASYGTPITNGPGCSWSKNASCDASTSYQVVNSACVGKSACSIEVGVSTFGTDPCPGVYKFLAVELLGNCSIPPPGEQLCQLNTYSRVYTVNKGGGNTSSSALYYQKLMPRNDTQISQVIPFVVDVPTSNVTIRSGVLRTAFDNNILYLKQHFTVDNMLFQFRKRADIPNPPNATCIGWDCTSDWIEGSIAGLFLMGAGGHLRWTEDTQLRQMMNDLIDGIESCAEPDGYLAAFDQTKLATDEHPDYTTSWTVHGFLEAAIAGNQKALSMIRKHMNVFNNHTLIPTFLPPDGGNWPYQNPEGPWPPGFDNKTQSGSGTMTGHTVYLIVQGIIHNTMMALSPVGTQADIDLVSQLYSEPWWLEALAAQDLNVIGHKVYFSHNYQLRGVEAYLDMYILTGEMKYLDAVMGAWAMHRDPLKGWIHTGGSLAINEGDIYEPGSFWLKQGIPPHENSEKVPFARKRDWFRADREKSGTSNEMRELVSNEMSSSTSALHKTHKHNHHHGEGDEHHTHNRNDHHGDGLESKWNGAYPTGEFCGAVFWLKINQRLHRLFPDNETFVLEIEREVYNEGLAHQGPIVNGISTGIRYFSNLNGVKESPGTIGTCCEGQGTRLYGSLNEYLFSLSPKGVYVNIYAPASISFQFEDSFITLDVFTDWPYDNDIRIDVSASPPLTFEIAIRIPSWVSESSIPISINGSLVNSGIPGSYLKLTQYWTSLSHVTFSLPMNIRSVLYTGVSQMLGLTRYSYLVGPVLLAATTVNRFNISSNALIVPTVSGSRPDLWAVTAGDGNSLHYLVDGVDDVLFQPAWEVNAIGAIMTSFPYFENP
jgi:hypothetical protein